MHGCGTGRDRISCDCAGYAELATQRKQFAKYTSYRVH